MCTCKNINNIVNLHNYSENFLWVISPVIEEFLNTRKCILHYWGCLVKSIDMGVLHLVVFFITLFAILVEQYSHIFWYWKC